MCDVSHIFFVFVSWDWCIWCKVDVDLIFGDSPFLFDTITIKAGAVADPSYAPLIVALSLETALHQQPRPLDFLIAFDPDQEPYTTTTLFDPSCLVSSTLERATLTKQSPITLMS